MTTTMNRLPVATWNPLGVNYAPASAALPTVPADGWAKAETLSPALPAGVTAPAEADFGDFAASGMARRPTPGWPRMPTWSIIWPFPAQLTPLSCLKTRWTPPTPTR